MRTSVPSRFLLQLPLLAALGLAPGCSDAPAEPADLPPDSSIWPERVVTPEAETSDNPWLRDFGADGTGGATTAPQPTGGGSDGAGASAGSLGTGGGGTGGTAPGESDPTPPPRWAVFRGYIETTSSAKALVIDEPGGASLAGCRVVIFSNGGVEPYRTFELTSSAARVVLCIGEPGIACDDLRTGNGFNGDDAVTLECDGAVRDVVGQLGVDPGDAWSGSGADGTPLSTKDQAFWRCTHPSEQAGAFSWAEWIRWNPASAPLPNGPTCPAPPNDGNAGSPGG